MVGGSGVTTSTTAGGSGGSGSGGGGSGGGPGSVTYSAAIAECIDPLAPDPVACKAAVGNVKIDVDLMDEAAPMHPNHGYLRFELDGAIAGKTIDMVRLELVVGNAQGDEGGGSGEVHRVSSFSASSLNTTAPTSAGLLAGDQGAVALNELVSFSLPTNLAVANGTIYLGLIPTSTNGTHYWNNAGAVPPILVVDYH